MLKHVPHFDNTDLSSGSAVNGAKKLKTSAADVNMPSFTDMMAYVQTKVRAAHKSLIVMWLIILLAMPGTMQFLRCLK